jgi:hypothetical protein
MAIDHISEFPIRFQSLPFERGKPVLEKAPCPTLALMRGSIYLSPTPVTRKVRVSFVGYTRETVHAKLGETDILVENISIKWGRPH